MSPQAPSKPHEVWKLIERSFTLRHSLVARDWAIEHLQARNAVIREARKRRNAAHLGPAWVEMELEDMNRRAEWAYKTCCEIWKIQKRPKSRAFYRAVFDWCLAPIFGIRVGCFQAELKMHQMRTRQKSQDGNSRIFAHMNREVMRLRAEWNTKLELARLDAEQEQSAAVREAEQNRIQADRTTPIALPSTAGPIPAVMPTRPVTLNTVRRETRRLQTLGKYERWQREYRRLVKTRPGKSDVWYSQQISRLEISKDNTAETIRKHMKK
jgi:hypothetical protein